MNSATMPKASRRNIWILSIEHFQNLGIIDEAVDFLLGKGVL
jgi:hypothetical protein